jgi:regulator of replication initiation timing
MATSENCLKRTLAEKIEEMAEAMDSFKDDNEMLCLENEKLKHQLIRLSNR